MRKIVALLMAVLMLCSILPLAALAAEEGTSATIAFDDTSKRTEHSATKQVWTENGITVTHEKADSTSDIVDNYNPIRCYKSSAMTIAYTGMKEISVACDSVAYAKTLEAAISGSTVYRKGSVVTIVLAEAADTFSIVFSAGQVRIDAITVSTVAAEVVIPSTAEEIVNAAHALEAGEYLIGEYTLTGVITSVDTAYSAEHENITVTMVVGNMTDKPIQCYRLKGIGVDALKVGDTITVTGDLTKYKTTAQFASGCTLETPDPEAGSTLTIEEAVALGKTKDSNTYTEGKYYVTGVITEVYSEKYGNMYIADENGNKLTIYGTYSADGSTRYDAMEVKPVAGDTVTVYGVIGQYNGTAQMKNGWITAHTPAEGGEEEEETPAPTTPAEIVDAAYALEAGDSLEGEYTLTGVITAVGSPYSEQYKNITVTIAVEGKEDMPIVCFRMKGEGVDQITVGDTVTVTGTLINYDGTIEFSPCTLDSYVKGENEVPVAPEDPKEIVDAAYALEEDTALPYTATLTGKVTEIGDPYSEQYKNITVTIVVEGCEDKPIVCFRLKGEGADTIKVGDTITVTGTLKNYKGTVEFDSGCQLVDLIPGTGDFGIIAVAAVMLMSGSALVLLKKKEF